MECPPCDAASEGRLDAALEAMVGDCRGGGEERASQRASEKGEEPVRGAGPGARGEGRPRKSRRGSGSGRGRWRKKKKKKPAGSIGPLIEITLDRIGCSG